MKRCIARILLVVLLFDSIMGYLPYTVKAAQTDESYGEVTINGCDADSNLLYEQTADGIKITGVSDNTISELVIPESISGNSVTEIGENAFYNSAIEKLTVPSSVEKIDNGALHGMDQLQELTIPYVGEQKKATGKQGLFGYIFGSDEENTENNTTTQNYSSSETYESAVPASLRKVTVTDAQILSYGAFHNCANIEKIELNEGITNIENRVFESCNALESMKFPDSVVQVGYRAFYNCQGMKELVIPDQIEKVGDYFLYGCSGLEKLTIPYSMCRMGYDENKGINNLKILHFTPGDGSYINYSDSGQDSYTNRLWSRSADTLNTVIFDEGITQIGTYAFYRMNNLETVIFPDGLTEIGCNAFYECKKIKKIEMPKTLRFVDKEAFYNCSGIEELSIPACMGVGLRNDNGVWGAFKGCTGIRKLTVTKGAQSDKMKSYNATNHLYNNYYTHRPWYSSYGKIEEIVVEEGITNIGCRAFYGCVNVKTISLPETITNIEEKAFEGCNNLEKIEIPNSVTQMDANAFTGCIKLREIAMPTAMAVDKTAFTNCKNLHQVTLKNTGTMPAYEKGETPWYGSKDTLEKVVLEDGVPNVSDNAFVDCAKLETINIPESVTSIGDNAFKGCSSLKSIYIPSSVRTIGTDAFENTVIHGEIGSYAYEYAVINNLKFSSIQSIVLDKTDIKVKRYNKDIQLKLTATQYSGDEYEDPEILWESTDTSVVSVRNGLLTFIGPGDAVVSATVDGMKQECKVHVAYDLENIIWAEKDLSISIDVGDSYKPQPTFVPANTNDDTSFVWKSANEAIAKVSEDGTITAVSRGTTCITATSNSEGLSGRKQYIDVTVCVPMTGLRLSRDTWKVKRGDEKTLKVTVLPENTTDSYKWSSSDGTVVQVDQEGNVKAVGNGTADIIVTSSRGKTASCTFTVYTNAEKVTFKQASYDVFLGDTIELMADIEPENITESVVYTSSDEKILKQISEGTWKAVSPGTAVVSVKTSDTQIEASCEVIVTNDISKAEVKLGTTKRYKTGKEIKPEVIVSGKDVSLSQNKDYIVAYKDNVEVGTATVEITGIGNYSGKVEAAFEILPVKVRKPQSQISVGSNLLQEDYAIGWTKSGGQKVFWGGKTYNVIECITDNENRLHTMQFAKKGRYVLLDADQDSGFSQSCYSLGTTEWKEKITASLQYQERNAVAETILQKNSYEITNGSKTEKVTDALSKEKYFVLSAYELKQYYNDTDDSNKGCSYWTRTQYGSGDYAYMDSNTGEFGKTTSSTGKGQSIAFHIDLDKVAFVQNSTFDKTVEINSKSSQIQKENSEVRKMTLFDSDIVCNAGNATLIDGNYYLPYTITGADASNVNQISLVIADREIMDEDAEILYYGKIGNGTERKCSFSLPEDIALNSVKFYILAEKVNQDNETDYCSEVVSVDLANATIGKDVEAEITIDEGKDIIEVPYNEKAFSLDGIHVTDDYPYTLDVLDGEDVIAVVNNNQLKTLKTGTAKVQISLGKAFVCESKVIDITVVKKKVVINSKQGSIDKKIGDADFAIPGISIDVPVDLCYEIVKGDNIASVNAEGVVSLKGKVGTCMIKVYASDSEVYDIDPVELSVYVAAVNVHLIFGNEIYAYNVQQGDVDEIDFVVNCQDYKARKMHYEILLSKEEQTIKKVISEQKATDKAIRVQEPFNTASLETGVYSCEVKLFLDGTEESALLESVKFDINVLERENKDQKTKATIKTYSSGGQVVKLEDEKYTITGYSVTPKNAGLTYEITEGNEIAKVDMDGTVTLLGAGYAEIKIGVSEAYDAEPQILKLYISKNSKPVLSIDPTMADYKVKVGEQGYTKFTLATPEVEDITYRTQIFKGTTTEEGNCVAKSEKAILMGGHSSYFPDICNIQVGFETEDWESGVYTARIEMLTDGEIIDTKTYTFQVLDVCDEHLWNQGTVQKKATCTTDGEMLYICTRCGKKRVEKINAYGHKYSTEWTIDKQATWYTEGSKSHHCIVCGDKIDITPIPKLWNENIEIGAKGSDVRNNTSYTITGSNTIEYTGYVNAEENVTVPTSILINGTQYYITSINPSAFEGNTLITSVEITAEIKSIKANTFKNCINLKTVSIPAQVKTIEKSAFEGCKKLSKVIWWGKNVKTIGDRAFKGCIALKKIVIPQKVTKIGKSAFEGCKKLKTITFKTTKLSKVGSKAFKGIHAKACMKVPKTKLKEYKKKLKNKGQRKSVKIK